MYTFNSNHILNPFINIQRECYLIVTIRLFPDSEGILSEPNLPETAESVTTDINYARHAELGVRTTPHDRLCLLRNTDIIQNSLET